MPDILHQPRAVPDKFLTSREVPRAPLLLFVDVPVSLAVSEVLEGRGRGWDSATCPPSQDTAGAQESSDVQQNLQDDDDDQT